MYNLKSMRVMLPGRAERGKPSALIANMSDGNFDEKK
jgi:hypothetical protein